MTCLHSESDRILDLAVRDDYRAWLISRNPAPIVHHSGEMHWKRLRVLARLTRNHIKAFFATIHVALVADKMRRAQRQLSVRVVRHDRAPNGSTDRGRP